MAARFEAVARVLGAAEVKFIVIGGWAAALHGSPRTTLDVDVVYSRDAANIEKLAKQGNELAPETGPHED